MWGPKQEKVSFFLSKFLYSENMGNFTFLSNHTLADARTAQTKIDLSLREGVSGIRRRASVPAAVRPVT